MTVGLPVSSRAGKSTRSRKQIRSPGPYGPLGAVAVGAAASSRRARRPPRRGWSCRSTGRRPTARQRRRRCRRCRRSRRVDRRGRRVGVDLRRRAAVGDRRSSAGSRRRAARRCSSRSRGPGRASASHDVLLVAGARASARSEIVCVALGCMRASAASVRRVPGQLSRSRSRLLGDGRCTRRSAGRARERSRRSLSDSWLVLSSGQRPSGSDVGDADVVDVAVLAGGQRRASSGSARRRRCAPWSADLTIADVLGGAGLGARVGADRCRCRCRCRRPCA